MKTEKAKKLVANFHDKTNYIIHIRNLKQSLNYGLVLEKVHRVIKFNLNAWLKPFINMKTEYWYDYVKPKYGEKAKLYYIDTFSLYT